MRALFKLTTAAALALLLGGCGGTKTLTVTKSSTTPAATSTSASAGTATSTAPTPSATGTAPTPSATGTQSTPSGPTKTVHLSALRSPSGNIGCQMASGYARCDIRRRNWRPPPRPSSCPFDYGQGLSVNGSGAGQLVCAGDTALDPTAPVLPYGAASVSGAVRCLSASTGMTCTNTRTRHGFAISIEGYRTF